MTVIVCYAKCTPCQFGECEPGPHTWMESEDLEHEGIPAPTTPEGWTALATKRPCGCWCQKPATIRDHEGVTQ